MCQVEYDSPYLFLFEFHIGDGYFDRQPIGNYSILVTYRNDTKITIDERERGDDRLVKFRQGKTIIFAISRPEDEMRVKFQAFDNREEIGESYLYFAGHGSPNNLASLSVQSPNASVIRTNLQLSQGAGSLQVFARLSCFGTKLLTDFSVSNDVNTVFDMYVSDMQLTAEESFTRCQFDIGDVIDAKEISKEKDVGDLLKSNEPSFCFYETSNMMLDESDEVLQQTIESGLNQVAEDVKTTMDELIGSAILKSNSVTNFKASRNFDDIIFPRFSEFEEFNSHELQVEDNKILSADNSILDLKEYHHENSVEDDELPIELKIGDAPASDDRQEEEKDDKSEEDKECNGINEQRISEEFSHETGDAPNSSEGTVEESVNDTKMLLMKSNTNELESERALTPDEKEIDQEEDEDGQKNKHNQMGGSKKRCAKGKRRGNYKR